MQKKKKKKRKRERKEKEKSFLLYEDKAPKEIYASSLDSQD